MTSHKPYGRVPLPDPVARRLTFLGLACIAAPLVLWALVAALVWLGRGAL